MLNGNRFDIELSADVMALNLNQALVYLFLSTLGSAREQTLATLSMQNTST